MLGWHLPTRWCLPEAPGSIPEPLACIEWESIEVIIKTTSRSKCYIEFHSYCLEGEVAPGDRKCTVGVSQPQLKLCLLFFPH